MAPAGFANPTRKLVWRWSKIVVVIKTRPLFESFSCPSLDAAYANRVRIFRMTRCQRIGTGRGDE
jgi:hypothetical protein